jgi:NAD(P)H dehydrogenase (quinone)
LLRERVDAGRIVALSRTPERLASLGVTTRPADFNDPSSLVRAFDGAERVLLVSTDDLRPGGHRQRQHAQAVESAVAAGVGQIIYTSAPRASDPANDALIIPDHAATERVLAASGVPYTILRNNLYADLLLAIAPGAIASGVLRRNTGDGRIGYGVRADFAEVAAVLLAEGGHTNEVIELTGPTSLSGVDLAAILSEVSGRQVRYEAHTDADEIRGLLAHGLPKPVAEFVADLGRATRDGWFDLATTAVAEITGHPATSVLGFLAAQQHAVLPA